MVWGGLRYFDGAGLLALKQVSLSKSCFYNDRVSHLAADKTLTDAHFIIVLINGVKKVKKVSRKMTRQNI